MNPMQEIVELKKALSKVQSHAATAWNRGHTAGLAAAGQSVREAVDAMDQARQVTLDENARFTDLLEAAEAERDAFRAVLEGLGMVGLELIAKDSPERARLTGETLRKVSAGVREQRDQLLAAISSAESVFVNMKRGTIPTLSVRCMVDLHGEVVNGEEAQLLEIAQLRTEIEALREKAEKFAIIERCMEQLQCDEREGGIVTACTLLLIGSAHQMNAARAVVTQEGVTISGEVVGDWRVTIERTAKPKNQP